MLINGNVALKGSSNEPHLQEFGVSTDTTQSTTKRGIIKFANGMKIQWDTVSIGANGTTTIDLREPYSKLAWSAYSVNATNVGNSDQETDNMAWVPSTNPLTTVDVRHIGGSTEAITYVSIGQDEVPFKGIIDGKALDLNGNEWTKNKAAGDLLNIDNEWSIQANLNHDFDVLNSYIISIQNDDSNKGQITMQHRAADSPETVQCQIRNTTGSMIKNFKWNKDIVVGTNISYMLTWDGTDMKMFLDGVDQGTPDTLTSNNSGTMEDSAREIAFGNLGTSDFGDLGANFHSVSMWNVTLTPAEITALDNSGTPENHDNRFSIGAYTRTSNLMHYWRLGFDSYDLGRDYGNAPLLVNVDEDSTGISGADIVDY